MAKPKIAGIYVIRNTINDRVYVGSSRNCEGRFTAHRCALEGGRHYAKHLQSAWKKYGKSAFKFEVVEIVKDLNFLLPREQFWIWRMRANKTGYNTVERPDHPAPFHVGRKRSSETRARLAEAARASWSRGRSPRRDKGSEEMRERMRRAAAARRPWSAERKAKLAARMSVSRKGKIMSEEQRRKISAGRVGKPLSSRHRAAVANAVKRQNADHPDILAKRMAGLKKAFAASDSPATRQKISDHLRYRWADPAFKARLSGILKDAWARKDAIDRESISAAMRKAWTEERRRSTAERSRKMWAERRATGAPSLWTQEMRAKKVAAMKALWAQRRALAAA